MRAGLMVTAIGLTAGGCLEATPGEARDAREEDVEVSVDGEVIGDGEIVDDLVAPCGCPFPKISVAEGDEVLPQTRLGLDGTQSVPCFGTIEGYEWRVERPEGSTSVFTPSAYVASPTFEVDVVGVYRFSLAVADAAGPSPCAPATYEVTVTHGAGGLRVELTWATPNDPDESDEETVADVDLHLAHPFAQGEHDRDGDGLLDGWFDSSFDCFWMNEHPNWGSLAWRGDDPVMLRDDTAGAGPEVIELPFPEDGLTYRVGVHYYNAHGFGPSYATVRVYADRRLVFEARDVALDHHELWSVTEISWPIHEVPLAPARACADTLRACASDADCGGAPCGPRIVPGYLMPGTEP